MQQLKVPSSESGRRIDKFLLRYFDAAPKSFFYKAFRKKNIKLNGKRADGSETLEAGDMIELFFSDETLASLRTKTVKASERTSGFPLRKKSLDQFCSIIYEDDNVIIADKRSGVLSQKAAAVDYSVNEALVDYCRSREDTDEGGFTPSVCNRIDRNTSGLIIFAKTYGASRELFRVLKDRTVDKYYLAVVEGRVEFTGRFEAWISKDQNSNKVTVSETETEGASHIITLTGFPDKDELEVLGFDSVYGSVGKTCYTILKIKLVTGKSHQIRAHMAFTGHALLGDIKYGDKALCNLLASKCGIHSQLLHSWKLIMPQDLEQPLGCLSGKAFTAPVPDKFKKLR